MASIVFKVKYEETLRRFNVGISGDQRFGHQRLCLTMEGLRLKIQSLLNLPLDAKFRLTYNDEDDDLVTLVDDDDLHDIVKQGLDPVRITVHLNSDQCAQISSTQSSGSSALGTPSPQNDHPNIHSNFDKVLKSMPEPSIIVVPSRSTDPNIAKSMKSVQMPLIHPWPKMGQSYVSAAHPHSGTTSVSRHVEVSNDLKPNSDGSKHEGVRNDDSERITEATGVSVIVKGNSVSCESSANKMFGSDGMMKKLVTSRTKYASNKDREEAKILEEIPLWTAESIPLQKDASQKESNREVLDKNKGYSSIPLGECPFGGISLGFQSLKQTHSSNRSFNKADSLAPIIHKGITCDGCEVHPIAGPRFKSKVRYDYDLCNNCFSKMGNDIDYTRIDFPLACKQPRAFKAPRVFSGLGSVFHTGITCDSCGIVPIAGPRFMSKVKYDYDLCNTCFSQKGNDADYTRINFPLPHKQIGIMRVPDMAASLALISHKGVGCNSCGILPITGPRFKSKVKYDYDLCSTCFLRMRNDRDYTKINFPLVSELPWSLKIPSVKSPCPYIRPHVLKQLGAKLDSDFIMDVNVMDGTTMAPSTPFTKIWRMRNNGTLPWVQGLQLIRIGGDRFRPSDSIEIQVPSAGVGVGHELNIAVDFIAPELPGRYISFWRMAEPSGQKFGQRVWVQIEVDPLLDLTPESSPITNLNLSPDNKETVSSNVVDVKVELESDVEVGASRPPFISEQNQKIHMTSLNFPINDDLLVAVDVVNPCSISALSSVPPSAANADRPGSPVASSPNSYPQVDSNSCHIPETSAPLASDSTVEELGESLATRSNVQDDRITRNKNSYLEQVIEKTELKEILLKELEEIRRINLNKEVPLTNETGRAEDDGVLHSNAQDYNVVDENSKLEPVNEKTGFKEKLLMELEEIGFKRIDLNKEALQTNETGQPEDDLLSIVQGDNITLGENWNIEQVNEKSEFKEISLDHTKLFRGWDYNEVHQTNKTGQSEDNLFDDSEWDPILEELMEMGFEDKDTNKKLLAKNNGSISRVVMDLIAEEKA